MKTRTAMKTWMAALALTAAGTMLATSAFAQTPAGGSPKSTGTDVKSSTTAEKGAAPATSDMKSDAKKTGLPERSAQGAGSPEQLKAVQQALKDKGHDPGDVDGKMGPKTEAALRDFQQKEGLKATGQADAETMTKLGVEAKTGAVDTSSSSPAASPAGAKQSK